MKFCKNALLPKKGHSTHERKCSNPVRECGYFSRCMAHYAKGKVEKFSGVRS